MNNIESILERIKESYQIENLRPLYQGVYYEQNKVRSAIFECDYRGKSVVLKVVDDIRVMPEISAHQQFLEKNTSKKIKAPEVFDAEQVSPSIAWTLMEKIPDGEVFDRETIKAKKQEFLDVFLEYKQHFPTEPSRTLTISEHLPANDYHIMRLSRWADLANTKEYTEYSSTGQRLVEPVHCCELFHRSMELLHKHFADRPMVWSKGNFWPKHLVKTGPEEYYIFDFSLTKMYPEGYELGGIVWSQYLMAGHYDGAFEDWYKGIQEWMTEVEKLAETLKYKHPKDLIRMSMLERTWGTILADVLASDKHEQIKRQMLGHLIKLVEKLIG